MEISGNDYVFFSSVPVFSVYAEILTMLESRWPTVKPYGLEIEGEESLEVFFAKDEAMWIRSDEEAFEPDENVEGIVLLIASRKEIDADADFAKFHWPEDYGEVYDYRFRMIDSKIWIYSLVLPGSIKENEFSRYVYNQFVGVLRKSHGIG